MPFFLLLVLIVQIALFAFSVPTAHAEAVRGSLFVLSKTSDVVSASAAFKGRAAGSMFEKRPAHVPALATRVPGHIQGRGIELIRALIQEAESRRDGYDAVQHGARIKPRKRPTQMTLAEIFQWIEATPNQPHAIGRYQFIPSTLRRVVTEVGAKPSQRFTAALQDRLADVLLMEAGLNRFQAGALDRKGFMNNLAKIWAGLPNSTGKSHYDGYAGNKASVSWARFDAVMTRVAPEL
ncbi:lysozyme family protein [Sulfitobacter guttiformis]|uniref:Muramidase (Phage lysozyme) n=1 Tax=Sulfitobacter guttiformis TaxID=74349 RepID=A0A420DI26_9RHOB|nr:hypothetical protein [Sulfitobacter guttiformis]KIN72376.1 hypothetical protein Z949_1549 [Sulfitobacter guttiformis KCTC 32187]RKE93868.1 hypothetical protein C8N30_2969 [Sulfitobacter guttiformis]